MGAVIPVVSNDSTRRLAKKILALSDPDAPRRLGRWKCFAAFCCLNGLDPLNNDFDEAIALYIAACRNQARERPVEWLPQIHAASGSQDARYNYPPTPPVEVEVVA